MNSPVDYSGDSSIRPLSDGEFGLFQAFVLKEAGIYLSEMKKPLLVGRLARWRFACFASFEARSRSAMLGRKDLAIGRFTRAH